MEIVRIWSYSDPYFSVFSPNAENTDQNNSEYGHFLRNVSVAWVVVLVLGMKRNFPLLLILMVWYSKILASQTFHATQRKVVIKKTMKSEKNVVKMQLE